MAARVQPACAADTFVADPINDPIDHTVIGQNELSQPSDAHPAVAAALDARSVQRARQLVRQIVRQSVRQIVRQTWNCV